VPVEVQPLTVPVSKSPLVMPPVGGGGGGLLLVTVIEPLAVWLLEPAPVTVNAAPDAAGAVEAADSVSVEVAPAVVEVTLGELNWPLTPEGRPDTLSETDWLLPEVVLTVTVKLALLPAETVADEGERVTENPLGGGVVPFVVMQAFCEFDHSFCTT
jgi:hypothetical protein